MNAYDFDQTIYKGDATAGFYWHCLKRYPKVLLYSFGLIGSAVRFLLGGLDKTRFKQRLFGFVRHVPEIELEVKLFWDRNQHRIKKFYLAQKRHDDLIISASPEFLLRPMLDRLGVRGLIASRVDPRTGAFDGLNCQGEEKLSRLRAERPDARIDRFYSDSLSDAPLAMAARSAHLVKGERLTKWPE